MYRYLKTVGRYWLFIGTIMIVISTSRSFQFHIAYVFAILVVWGLIVGIPSFLLIQLGKRLDRPSAAEPAKSREEA